MQVDANDLREIKETIKENPAKTIVSQGDCEHGQGCALWRVTSDAAHYGGNKLYWNSSASSLNK